MANQTNQETKFDFIHSVKKIGEQEPGQHLVQKSTGRHSNSVRRVATIATEPGNGYMHNGDNHNAY
jgi:hypothetical protein